jgi:hypothetical protein
MDTDNEFRAGRYILQPQGYRAFIPANLPPIPPIAMDDEMWTLLSDADRAIGGLDGSRQHQAATGRHGQSNGDVREPDA